MSLDKEDKNRAMSFAPLNYSKIESDFEDEE